MQFGVSGMETARDVVLVTNAAQRELMGEFPEIKHACTIDLSRSLLMYDEGVRLKDAGYRNRLIYALHEAGYSATTISVTHTPSEPLYVANLPHPIVVWPDRHRLTVHIPDMKNSRDANRVTDALAYGRLGSRPANLEVNVNNHTVTVRNQNRRLAALGNYAHSIVTAGYGVNGWAKHDATTDPPARGWLPYDG